MRDVIRVRAEATGHDVQSMRDEYLKRQAVPRLPSEDEVAGMVSYPASEAAAAVTSQAIDVSCGYA